MGFCGNPNNHRPHIVTFPSGTSSFCEGVDRIEVSETIVEKYDPAPMTEDGTEYVKIKIFIERQNGDTEIILAEKASAQLFEVDYSKVPNFEDGGRINTPTIERATFSFTPFRDETGNAIKIERKNSNER